MVAIERLSGKQGKQKQWQNRKDHYYGVAAVVVVSFFLFKILFISVALYDVHADTQMQATKHGGCVKEKDIVNIR